MPLASSWTRAVVSAIDWWIPEHEENRDRVTLLRKQLFVVLCVLVSGNTLGFAVLHRMHDAPGSDVTVVWLLGILSLVSPMALGLLRLGVSFFVCGRLFIAVFLVGLIAVSYVDGGPESGAVFWLLAAPLAASFLANARLGWLVAAAVAVVGVSFYALDVAGHVFPHGLTPEDAKLHQMLNFVSVAAFMAAMAWLYESPTIRHLRLLSTQLADANAELRRELDARRRAQVRAEEANRAKTVLLENMSHEFRTPITAILGAAELLADDADAEQREVVDMVDRGARRLLHTLDGVLELAWVESGGDATESRPLDVTATVRTAVAATFPQALQKGLAFEVVGEPAVARSDARTLRRLVGALADNAVKFTEQGRVAITVRNVPEGVLVEVADTGVGIDPEFRPHLFTPFRQGSEGLARSHEGAGIGLAVADGLARQIGATLSVRSEPGRGSVFSVCLPAPTRAAEVFA